MYTLIVNGRPSESQRSATTRIQLFGDTEASKVICTRKERLPSVSTAIDGISFNLRKSCCIGKCILKLKSVNFAVTSIWPPKLRRWKCKRGVIKRRPRGHALRLPVVNASCHANITSVTHCIAWVATMELCRFQVSVRLSFQFSCNLFKAAIRTI